MAERLKILISAYACEHGRGSEPEVGWRSSLEMAKYHDVTVLTRANNQANIEAGLATYNGPHPSFIYYDLPPWGIALKRRGMWVSIYYLFWQLGARLFMRRRLPDYDLIQHATFNSFRQAGFWWFCPAPVVLGPLGGGQICPWRFLPWFRRQIVYEFLRSTSVVNSYIFPHIYLSLYFADKILVANDDTQNCIPWLFRGKVIRMLETGVTPQQVTKCRPPRTWDEVRFLWISRLDKMKGCEFAIQAFAKVVQGCPSARLTIAGGGPEEQPIRRLIHKLELDQYVECRGAVPKDAVASLMLEHDAFVFTSLRDTSGNVLLEAMAAGLPAITFLHHGSAEITTERTALRVPVGTGRATVNALSDAMLTLAKAPKLREEMGKAGRERVEQQYLWEQQGRRLNAIFQNVVSQDRLRRSVQRDKMRVLLAPKGVLLTLGILFSIGATAFYSLSMLRRNAETIVNDTLPGLSYAGAANSSLTQSFNQTALAILSTDRDQMEANLRAMETASRETTKNLAAYEKAIYEEADRRLFNKLIEQREVYLALREGIVANLREDRRDDALKAYSEKLLPSFAEYKMKGDALLHYNIQQGRFFGERIIRLGLITQFVVAGLAVIVFLAGFALGFFR